METCIISFYHLTNKNHFIEEIKSFTLSEAIEYVRIKYNYNVFIYEARWKNYKNIIDTF
jgi:hypothetical protein